MNAHFRSLLHVDNCSETLNCGFMTKFFFILSNDAVLSAARSAAVSKSGFNLFNAVVLPSQTALWFMNTLHANAFYYASFSCGNRRIILNGAEEEAQALLSI